jgi:hypothetical protein
MRLYALFFLLSSAFIQMNGIFLVILCAWLATLDFGLCCTLVDILFLWN